uniref:Uncharacterized protein n=1 Tax=Romanomermis culicivorax TaxID=13658 RepID=A0A915HST8_ROMCU
MRHLILCSRRSSDHRPSIVLSLLPHPAPHFVCRNVQLDKNHQRKRQGMNGSGNDQEKRQGSNGRKSRTER